MTKKDYELIAFILRTQLDKARNAPYAKDIGDYIAIIYAFADNLQYTQPRFNRTKFLKFCGINE